jgi:hypothetical protein
MSKSRFPYAVNAKDVPKKVFFKRVKLSKGCMTVKRGCVKRPCRGKPTETQNSFRKRLDL